VTHESRFPFIQLPFDGIFGLGLAGLSAGPNFNFVSRMKLNSTIQDPTFAFFLRDLNLDEDSEVTFGGFKRNRLASELTWLPMPKDEAHQKGYWLVTMRDVYANGKPLKMCDDGSAHPRCQVAMDTGTSLMMGPREPVEGLHDDVMNLDGCMALKDLPTLRFEMDAEAGGSFDIVLAPEDYAEAVGDGCTTAFQGVDLPAELGSMWVFGQTVLRKYYSVYDAKHWRVGLGLAKHTTTKRVAESEATTTAAPAALVEACVDDNAQMVQDHLPSCKPFKAMGYCNRFLPLAHNMCRLSCGLCSSNATTSRGTATRIANENEQAGVSVVNRHVQVRGGGISVAHVKAETLTSI